MLPPFQCLAYCPESSPRKDRRGQVFFAAVGGAIYNFATSDLSLISSWRHGGSVPANLRETGSEEAERPEKRRKLSAGSGSSDSSAEIVVENHAGKDRRRPAKSSTAASPFVSKLIVSIDGCYLVAVTGEDKTIHVFKIDVAGAIEHVSERTMPKRPCSIALTEDNGAILCADKFGDVYSMPLHYLNPRQDPVQAEESEVAIALKPFTPSASAKTVHTKGNLQALQNQMRNENKSKEKKLLLFEHELLLGHVSLLTDLAYVTIPPEDPGSRRRRSYIITADRDEHIRVSRGMPQSHIIEGFCLGHTQFISKLCIPSFMPELLLSGGGDDYLLVWNWRNSKILQRLNLRSVLPSGYSGKGATDFLDDAHDSPGTVSPIAVTSIKAFQCQGPDSSDMKSFIGVAIEGSPNLVLYALPPSGRVDYFQTLTATGNVLDFVALGKESMLLISIDNVHVPYSTKELRHSKMASHLLLYSLFESGSLKWDQNDGMAVGKVNEWASQNFHEGGDERLDSVLSGLLYNTETLRKRGAEEDIL
ncbi:tRNA (guanine-N(7)-)-methyltransferase non-catalytic subunit trm82 [Agyrium rufum]|nr:tRNA (guanine-N(7)-)-methyltransferase non-catalytic subunit trm82 [Agyrium rufum]